MNAGWIAALLLSVSALAGCTGEAANPNLGAPKLVLQPRDDGNVTLFVHSAFGEKLYDWIRIGIDNETLVNRTGVFSWEGALAQDRFYLEVEAGVGEQVYEMRGHVEVDRVKERAFVSLLDSEGEWSEPHAYNRLPVEHILQRRDLK